MLLKLYHSSKIVFLFALQPFMAHKMLNSPQVKTAESLNTIPCLCVSWRHEVSLNFRPFNFSRVFDSCCLDITENSLSSRFRVCVKDFGSVSSVFFFSDFLQSGHVGFLNSAVNHCVIQA